jgi:hypothetical protein
MGASVFLKEAASVSQTYLTLPTINDGTHPALHRDKTTYIYIYKHIYIYISYTYIVIYNRPRINGAASVCALRAPKQLGGLEYWFADLGFWVLGFGA